MVIKLDEDDIPDEKIRAMLRHLWIFQLDILPDDTDDE
jgi:hypothetical protein